MPISTAPRTEAMGETFSPGRGRRLLVVEEATVVNGFGAYMAAVVANIDPSIKVIAHGVPDRVIYAAPRARQLAMCGLDAPGIAQRVRALLESEALAG